MSSFDEQPVLALGRDPIAVAPPCGEDAADDERYLAVDAELNKVGRIDLGEPDWYEIEQNSQAILQSKSKDVEMAVGLAYCLFKRARYEGLAAAIGLFTELTKNFWDDLYPKRPRRRKNRMEAFCEQLIELEPGWIAKVQPKPSDFDPIDLVLSRTEELAALLAEKMPDEEIDFKKFTRKLKELAAQRPKQAETPKPADAAPTAGAGGGGSPASNLSSAGGGGGGFVAGAVEDVSGAVKAIQAASTFIRKADPSEPLPYLIARAVKWGKIELPTSDAAKTSIEPPDKQTVEALEHQMNNGVWEHLLNGSEAAFRANDPLWLDLQRYTCAALAAQGAKYDKARQGVLGMTAALVRRLGSGLYDLTFRGGMPLVSGETRMWIETEVAPPTGSGEGGGGASNGRLTEAADEAKKLAGSGKLSEAVRKLQEGLGQCGQRRDRFLWRAQLAQLCYDAKKHALAAPLLKECLDEVRRFHIEDWEPEIAARVAETLYRCRRAMLSGQKAPTPEQQTELREAYAWLCQLDPSAALTVEPVEN